MADENQTPQVGPRQNVQPQQPQGPQGPPPKGMPGVPPPAGLPPNAAEIIAAQQAEVQRQIAEAQARARQGQPAQQPAQQGQPQQPVPSPVPGLTAQQVMAGMRPGQQQQQPHPQNQFAQYAPQQEPDKVVVRWHPGRNSDIRIELTDCIIVGIPEEIQGEPDPQAKVVLALFSEILALRNRLSQLEAGGAGQLPPDLFPRITRLEGALYEQANAMSQRARGVREQIELLTAQGLSPEQVLESLQSQAAEAEAFTAQRGRTDDADPSGE